MGMQTKAEQKREYEKLKALKERQKRGDKLTFAERNVLTIYEKKRRKKDGSSK